MKTVKFVKSLNIEEVPCIDRANFLEYSSFDVRDMVPLYRSSQALIDTDKTSVQKYAVPIYELFKWSTQSDGTVDEKETYIAISEEVDDLLGQPFAYLQQRNEFLEKEFLRLKILLEESKVEIEKLEGALDYGSGVAVEMYRQLSSKIYERENASWWRRLLKKWE